MDPRTVLKRWDALQPVSEDEVADALLEAVAEIDQLRARVAELEAERDAARKGCDDLAAALVDKVDELRQARDERDTKAVTTMGGQP